jgi:hypothetical protein
MRNAQESDQCEISYYTDTKDDQLMLYRREDPIIDDEPEVGGKRYILLENIKTFNLRFFEANRGNWVEDWDSTRSYNMNRLPSKVEITIGYENVRGNEETMTVATPIHMMTAIPKE